MPILSTPPAPSATTGGPGPMGPAGQSAYSFTSAPVSGYNGTSTLSLPVQNVTWLGVTAPVFIPNVGSFEVTAIDTTNKVLNLLPLNVGLATPPISIPSGTMVSASGYPGLNGSVGATGPQGPIGLQGPIGPQGLQGSAGQAGATGPTGPQGATGQQGTQGPPGTTGATGATGPQGPIGVKGDPGNQGIQGIQGPGGPQGVGGPVGATGPQGIQGPPGPAVTAKGVWQPSQIYAQGDLVTWNNLIYIALAGSQNAQPDQHPNLWAVYSSVGVQGPPGATGPIGPPGAQGPVGVPGPQGVPGPDGATGATGPAGSAGPTGNTGPAGAQGATGATGPMGPTGPQGVPGPSVVWRGNWTSAATYNPNDGVSYQGNSYVAISTNSNAPPPSSAWQLIAQQGATGSTGPAGATGATGPQGATGATGVAGPAGSTGPAGAPGAAGTAGANSWTLTTSNFTVPPLGQTAVVQVLDSSWAVVGEFVWVQSAGGASNIPMALQITAKTPTTVTLLNPATAGMQASGDAGNLLQIGSDSLLYLPASQIQPTIWSVRLRSFNAVGNPNFEVDQRSIHTTISNIPGSTAICDRWFWGQSGTLKANALSQVNPPIGIPSINFPISNSAILIQVATVQATLAAGDYAYFFQQIEGPMWRELAIGAHSISVLVYSTVAPVHFTVGIGDPGGTHTLVNLYTLPTAATWTLIPIPNLPAFPSGFSSAPGQAAYKVWICLGSGATYTAPAGGIWQSANYLAAPGTDNYFANPVNTNFYCAFVQHEPGSQCTTLIDKPWQQNYDECLRYYTKSYPYGNAAGTVQSAGQVVAINIGGQNPYAYIPFKRTMAKTPTVQCYSVTTGAAGMVRDASAGVDKAATTIVSPADSGFGGITVSSPNAATWQSAYQYTADTGW